jgi:hypothetical protein
MLGFWFGLDKEILFDELMSSFSKDSQKLHVSLISQFITQHLSPAIGLMVFLRLILLISNPLWLISFFNVGIKWTLINSWNGFFSIGNSFFGLGIVFVGVSFSFFLLIMKIILLLIILIKKMKMTPPQKLFLSQKKNYL